MKGALWDPSLAKAVWKELEKKWSYSLVKCSNARYLNCYWLSLVSLHSNLPSIILMSEGQKPFEDPAKEKLERPLVWVQ